MDLIKWLFILFIIVACNKENKEKEENQELASITFKNGFLLLNEGLFQQNNASLSWVDLTNNEVTPDFFLKMNDRLLGDTGNDIKRYYGKIYIVVNASSTIEVLNAKTLKSIAQLKLNNNGQGQQPRAIACWKNKVYVTSYDGYVNVIDTTTLTLSTRIKVGPNPEGLTIANNMLYVANSGGLNFPEVDSTVFEIDLNNNTIVDTFTVGNNPGAVIADDNGNIYVVKRGDYGADPSELVYINTASKEISNLHIPASTLAKSGELLYISYYDFNTQHSNVARFDLTSRSMITNALIHENDVQTLYGVYPFDDQSFICYDAMGFTSSGFLRFFDANGTLTKSISVGLNPNGGVYFP